MEKLLAVCLDEQNSQWNRNLKRMKIITTLKLNEDNSFWRNTSEANN